MPDPVAAAAAELLGWFTGTSQVTVAFSGGVDSSLVLAAAARALGPERVHAVTAVSDALPGGMLDAAREFASLTGVRHTELATREIDNPGYAANDARRCYFCKSTLVDTVLSARLVPADSVLVTGTNADDVAGGWRPGIRAAAERGAGTPLADAGLSKDMVRAISRQWGLPGWDRPASPCLSSRIAYGITITPARLARVDAAEQAVRAVLERAGISTSDLRVRDLGDAVRVEVDAASVPAAQQAAGVGPALSAAGFAGLGVTISPFRSGSLNAVLPPDLQFS